MSLYLCVDCGGSKTSTVISSPTGVILGRATSGPSNFAYLGLAAFTAAVSSAVSVAIASCPTEPSTTSLPSNHSDSPFASAWFGISGVDGPAAIAAVTSALAAITGLPVGPRLRVANDTALLAAPLATHPDVRRAVTVIAGTGSCCVAFERGAEEGALRELGRVGGWGWVLGDEGGGFHVGREAVRHVLWEADLASLSPPTFNLSSAPLNVTGNPDAEIAVDGSQTLRERILAAFGVNDPSELLTAVHVADPPPASALSWPSGATSNLDAWRAQPREKRLSALAPLVFASAFSDADPLALRVLRATAGALAGQIAALLAPALAPAIRAGVAGAPSTWPGRLEVTGDRRAPLNATLASEAVLCFGGSLVGQTEYRALVTEALAAHGHVFRYVEFVDDVAAVGARALAAAAQAQAAGEDSLLRSV